MRDKQTKERLQMRLNAQEIEGYLRGLPEDAHNELRGVIKKYLLMREQGEFIPRSLSKDEVVKIAQVKMCI